MLARTFVEVFPQAALVEVQRYEAALIALRGRGADASIIAHRMAVPGVAAHLTELGIADPLALPSTSGAALRKALGPGPVVTDDMPRIEHFAVGAAARRRTRPARNSSTRCSARNAALPHAVLEKRPPLPTTRR